MYPTLHLEKKTQFPGKGGFTLIEVMVAVSLLGMLSSSSFWALSQANNYAALTRLNTGAQIAAQNQIDLILSTGPFNPQSGQYGAQPADLTKLPVLTPGTSPPEDVLIYIEPDGDTAVTGQRVTKITDTGLPPVAGRNLYLYSATVVVTYNFRGKTYQVQLNAMRAPDADGV